MLQILLAGLVLFLAGSQPAVAVDASEKQAELRVLLDHSGLTQVIEQVPLFIQSGMSDSLQGHESGISSDDVAAISRILQQSFASDLILRDTLRHMEVHYDQRRVAGVRKHLTSPLGEKMTRLEISSSAPAALDAMLEYAKKLQDSPPDDARVAVMTELDQASHTTELTVAMQLEIFRTVVRVMGAYAAEQGDAQFIEDMLEQTIEAMSGKIWEEAQAMTLISFLYTYREASDAELRTYIDMHQDTDMQWYLALSSSALINALSRAMGNASQAVVRHLRGAERPS